MSLGYVLLKLFHAFSTIFTKVSTQKEEDSDSAGDSNKRCVENVFHGAGDCDKLCI